MAKTETNSFASPNPTFSGDVTEGGEHSSLVLPTEHPVEATDAQFDEALVDEVNSGNIAGTHEMETPCDWKAGEMTAWAENDDYRRFFEKTIGPCTALDRGGYAAPPQDIDHDSDYDDNGGIPTAVGHDAGYMDPPDRIGDHAFGLGAIILRRF